MNVKRLLVMAILFMFTACGSESNKSSGKGDEGLDGGDMQIQQTQLLVDAVVNKVHAMPEVFPEIDILKLEEIAQRVKLIGKKKTYANGVETDAVNDGDSTIYLNVTRWNQRKNNERKLALIFHEMLGILGLEKNNYAISSRFFPENRFCKISNYSCGECEMSLSYLTQRKYFKVTTNNCDHFNQTIFMKYQEFYSNNSFCDTDEDESTEPASCMMHNNSKSEWSSLFFQDGYNFYFTGFENKVLNCNLKKSI